MIEFNITEKSKTAIYIQLKNDIKAAIKSGKFPPMAKLPSVSEIAEASGVSLRTADTALRELIYEGVCFRRPKKGTFVSDMFMENDSCKQDICGILTQPVPMHYPLQTLLHCGIMESAARNNISSFMIPLQDFNRKESPANVIRRFDEGTGFNLRGIVAADFDCCTEIIKIAPEFPDKRFFLINYQSSKLKDLPPNVAAVVNDDYAGAYHLAQYIFSEYKIKKCVIMTMELPEFDMSYILRCKGFKKAISEEGVSLSAVLKIETCGYISDFVNFSYEAAKEFFLNGGEADFIFVVNDLMVSGVQKALEELKLSDKIYISGHDCLHNLQGSGFPTVKVAYTEMGKVAVEKMLDPDSKMQTVIKLLPEIKM